MTIPNCKDHNLIIELDPQVYVNTTDRELSEKVASMVFEKLESFETIKRKRKVLVKVPKNESIKIPLIKQQLEPKKKTKWEEFAEKKGIQKKNKNKFRFVHGDKQRKMNETKTKKLK